MIVIGQFTLRDMYEQFQNIMKMGPINQIIVSHFEPGREENLVTVTRVLYRVVY